MDELCRIFAPFVADESPKVRDIRGTALAMAQHWLTTIPAGPARDLAIHQLRDAAESAVKAVSLAA